MDDKRLWLYDPPEGSAEEWAQAYEVLMDLTARFAGDRSVSKPPKHALFALSDATERCAHEAERREPGITERPPQHDLEDTQNDIQDFD